MADIKLDNRIKTKFSINNIERKYILVFISSFAFGMLSHGLALFNKFSVHDDIASMYYLGAGFTSGRWMLGLIAELEYFLWGNGPLSMPLFNGVLSILFIVIPLGRNTSS